MVLGRGRSDPQRMASTKLWAPGSAPGAGDPHKPGSIDSPKKQGPELPKALK